MGITKTDFFTEKQNETALIFKALGHPARLAIIEFLLKKQSCVCGDIVSELPLAQPTISQHLRELKNAGIIQGTIEGNSICYCLNPQMFAHLNSLIHEISDELSKNNPSCC